MQRATLARTGRRILLVQDENKPQPQITSRRMQDTAAADYPRTLRALHALIFNFLRRSSSGRPLRVVGGNGPYATIQDPVDGELQTGRHRSVLQRPERHCNSAASEPVRRTAQRLMYGVDLLLATIVQDARRHGEPCLRAHVRNTL